MLRFESKIHIVFSMEVVYVAFGSASDGWFPPGRPMAFGLAPDTCREKAGSVP